MGCKGYSNAECGMRNDGQSREPGAEGLKAGVGDRGPGGLNAEFGMGNAELRKGADAGGTRNGEGRPGKSSKGNRIAGCGRAENFVDKTKGLLYKRPTSTVGKRYAEGGMWRNLSVPLRENSRQSRLPDDSPTLLSPDCLPDDHL